MISPRRSSSRIRRTFLEPQWDVKNLPGYSEETAGNPFATFADIPVRARYQFLLDDAEYEINTFIKGPVCNGSIAVNSIQAQFFVLFLRPDADGMVMSAEHARQAQDMLILPGVWGSDVPILDDIPFLRRLIAQREDYRKLRADNTRKLRPAGYTLEDIWNGDGRNPNALLTVFRHFDTAVVTQGAAGDLPKTLFVLDYPLLERLVYNLVVNYDVFGNVGHQALTRLYMDLIRMEAEELFLAFLPPSQRAGLRKSWYRGGPLTDLKLRYVFPLVDSMAPTGVVYRNVANAKAELVERVVNEHLSPQVRGLPDALNWKALRLPQGAGRHPNLLRQSSRCAGLLQSRPPAPRRSRASFPISPWCWCAARTAARGSTAWCTTASTPTCRGCSAESERFAPQEDTLTVRAGVLGAYPNMFFVVPEERDRCVFQCRRAPQVSG